MTITATISQTSVVSGQASVASSGQSYQPRNQFHVVEQLNRLQQNHFQQNVEGEHQASENGDQLQANAEGEQQGQQQDYVPKPRMEVEASGFTIEEAEAACAAGKINEKNLEFLKEVINSTSLTAGQKTYRDNLEKKIKAPVTFGTAGGNIRQREEGGADGSPAAKKPRIDAGNAKYNEAQIQDAHSKNAISDWERDRYEEWRNFTSLTERQMEFKSKIETKMEKFIEGGCKGIARPSFGGASSSNGSQFGGNQQGQIGGNQQGRKEVGKKYTKAELENAFSRRKINEWERDRMIEWCERDSLSEKQMAIKIKIEQKMSR